MLEWINNDFFWIPNKTPIYNIQKIDRFFIKEDEYYESVYSLNTTKHFWITIDFCNCNSTHSLIEVNSKKEGLDEIIKFLKNRPKDKKDNDKILIH